MDPSDHEKCSGYRPGSVTSHSISSSTSTTDGTRLSLSGSVVVGVPPGVEWLTLSTTVCSVLS